MTDREAMQMALEALERYQVKRQDFDRFADEITALRTALEQQAEPVFACPRCGHCCPQRKPLTDEDIEQAQRTIWRSLPSDFDYTTSSWIEIGIRYAEAAHDIKETS